MDIKNESRQHQHTKELVLYYIYKRRNDGWIKDFFL